MIIIPQATWSLLVQEFRNRRKRLEQVAYLDGIELEETGIVTTVTFPNALLRQGSFVVSADAMSQAGRHLSPPLVRLAQVHTHPGEWVGHSPTDDERAYSQHDGAVSIVFPHYAAFDSLASIGIHTCRHRTWRQLPPAEARGFLLIVPAILDFRAKTKSSLLSKLTKAYAHLSTTRRRP